MLCFKPHFLLSKLKIFSLSSRLGLLTSDFGNGGGKRDRTAGLLSAIQALSQLSYTPKYCLRLACSSSELLRIAEHYLRLFQQSDLIMIY